MSGPGPKPTAIKRFEGNPGKYPLPEHEPQYPPGLPEQPKRSSAAAKRIWNELIDEMADVGVLRRVDRRALHCLCEDEALLDEAYDSLWKMAARLKKKAEAEGKDLPGGAIGALLTMTNGRVALAAIRDLAGRAIVERREFGLTPSARVRIVADQNSTKADPLDDAMFNSRAELLVLKKSG
jgi:P27 family predicted phage terminase small subunit